MNTSAHITNNSQDCVVLAWNATIPWNNPNNLMTLEVHKLIETVKCVILLPLLYVIGAPANIINMLVFFRQGLKERINLCPFLLAAYDLVYLTTVLIYRASTFLTPFSNRGEVTIVYKYMTNENWLGLYGFGYMSMLVSTVIALERCVCVLFPLTAQRCVRTKVFAFVLILCTCIVGFSRFVVTAKYRTACFYEARTGKSSWQGTVNEYYIRNREMLNILDGIIYGFCLSVGCPVISLITTGITAVRLRQVVRWRESTSSSTAMSSKEIGVTKMLIYVSLEFVVFSIPFVILRILPMFDPELSPGGDYSNLFQVLISFAELSAYLSSCANFFVYYITGSRYRETAHTFLPWTSSTLKSEACKK